MDFLYYFESVDYMESKQMENKTKSKNQMGITMVVLFVAFGMLALSIIPLQAYAVKCNDCNKDDCRNTDYGDDGACGGQPPTHCNASTTKDHVTVCGRGF
jgi:hypothetical protein